MHTNQSWSLFIFAYNEAGNVERVVDQAITLLPRMTDKYELIIIDDGSTDGSDSYFRSISESNPNIRLVTFQSNRGIGNAMKKGYLTASYENVCGVPGDGQFDLAELLPYSAFDSNNFISFARKKKNYNWFRSLLTYTNWQINRKLLRFNLSDVNWIKAYKRDQLRSINLHMESSLIESEICAKLILKGYKPLQVPSTYHPRDHGVPKGASFKTVSKAVVELFILLAEIRRFRKSLNKSYFTTT